MSQLSGTTTGTGKTLAINNGLCLDVHGPDMYVNGGRIQVWGCHGGINQQWRLEQGMLINQGGLCLDVHGPDMYVNGGRVQVWGCHGGINQQWRLEQGMLINQGGLCLDVHGPDMDVIGGANTGMGMSWRN